MGNFKDDLIQCRPSSIDAKPKAEPKAIVVAVSKIRSIKQTKSMTKSMTKSTKERSNAVCLSRPKNRVDSNATDRQRQERIDSVNVTRRVKDGRKSWPLSCRPADRKMNTTKRPKPPKKRPENQTKIKVKPIKNNNRRVTISRADRLKNNRKNSPPLLLLSSGTFECLCWLNARNVRNVRTFGR